MESKIKLHGVIWIALFVLVLVVGTLCFKEKEIKKEEYISLNKFFVGEIKPVVVPYYYVLGVITAYSSTPEETDDTPFVTASGSYVGGGVIANNCFSFGTVIEIENEFYEVQDRMSERYDCERFDIWKEGKKEALEFGKQTKEVVIYK